jgi:hypothetical protein
MTDLIKKTLLIIAGTVLFIAFSAGAWFVGRNINYSLSYKSMVEQTIRDMVKREALKP